MDSFVVGLAHNGAGQGLYVGVEGAPRHLRRPSKRYGKAEENVILNGTGVSMNPGDPVVDQAPDPAFPALEKDVLIEAPESAGDVAEAVSPDFAGRTVLSSTRVGGKVVFVLPKERLKVYTLVRIGNSLTMARGN